MGLYIKQDEARSQLQQRISAELAEKAKRKAAMEGDRPDGVADSQYVHGTTHTSPLFVVWIIIGIVALVALILFIIANLR